MLDQTQKDSGTNTLAYFSRHEVTKEKAILTQIVTILKLFHQSQWYALLGAVVNVPYRQMLD
jgi:hypothetical protein